MIFCYRVSIQFRFSSFPRKFRDDPVDCVSFKFSRCFPVRPPLDLHFRGDDNKGGSVGRFESQERKTIDITSCSPENRTIQRLLQDDRSRCLPTNAFEAAFFQGGKNSPVGVDFAMQEGQRVCKIQNRRLHPSPDAWREGSGLVCVCSAPPRGKSRLERDSI